MHVPRVARAGRVRKNRPGPGDATEARRAQARSGAARIRPMEARDVLVLARQFEAHLDEQAQWDDLLRRGRREEFDPKTLFALLLATGEEQVSVAEAEGELLGFVRYSIQPPRGRSQQKLVARVLGVAREVVARVSQRARATRSVPTGLIADLYVVPASRRSGVGRQLATVALEWFVDQGIDVVALQVLEGNAAGRAFWERLGFGGYRRTLTLSRPPT